MAVQTDINHFAKILCTRLQLGGLLTEPTPVTGGFHHRMWRLETDNGYYAVKQLASDVNLEQPEVACHYESSEAVSRSFKRKGIPAVTAIDAHGQALQLIDGGGYLVYPWIDARALHRNEITPQHIEQVAMILAALHSADVSVDGLTIPDTVVTSEETLLLLTASARQRNNPRVAELNQALPFFKEVIARHAVSNKALMNHTTVSHGDLDHKNVLWQSPTMPMLIDWESARVLNPTHEVILEALDWSGITLDFNPARFNNFIAAYKQAGGDMYRSEVEAAFDCVLGDWVNWLFYNLGRSISLEEAQERETGLKQVDLSLVTIMHLQRQIPELLRSLR